MNTATISTRRLRLIVTCLLVTGLSACTFPDKRKPEHSQIDNVIPAETTETPVAAQTEYTKPKQTAIRLKKNHSRKYTVKKGDTLWDISSQFLRDPWYWPEIWHKNRQVQNPHLIYPDDELTLIYVNGQPQISVNETPQQVTPQQVVIPQEVIPQQVTPPVIRTTIASDSTALRRVKLSPSIRKHGIDADVFTIPGDAIRQFLTKPRVVTKEDLEEAPYILASDDNHLIMGQDNIVYIRGELDKDRVRFTVFRPGEELIDPETDIIFGFEAIYAGEVHIKKYGDPAIGQLTSSTREIRVGDRLLPVDKSKIDNLYYPRPPDHELKGQIISLHDALFGIAKYQIAVINRGSRDSLEVGHLLETLSAGGNVKDNYSLRQRGNIRLPDVRSGLMMVFRVFDKVSYGLILESTLVINNHDVVTTPR